jgi:tetratricopeptide (TPR) repeat protein
MDELASDRENLTAAFESALILDRPDLAADCWVLLARLAVTVGPAGATSVWFDRLPLDRIEPESRIRVIDLQCLIRRKSGFDTSALAQLQLDHWEAVGDTHRALIAAVLLAGGRAFQDPHGSHTALLALEDRVMASDDRSLQSSFLANSALASADPIPRLRRAAGVNPELAGVPLYNIGVVLTGRGEYEQALVAADDLDAWSEGRALSEPEFRMLSHELRGQVLGRQGRWDEAGPHLVDGMAIAMRLGNHRFVSGGFTQVLARKLLRDGDCPAARRLVESSLEKLRILEDAVEIAWGLSTLAELRLAEGDLEGARSAIDEAYALVPAVETTYPHVGCWVHDSRTAVEAAEAAADAL